MKTLARFLGAVALIVLLAMWNGFVLSVLWGWFFVPAFHLIPLSIPMAIGVSLVISTFTTQTPKKGEETSVDPTLFAILFPAFMLVFGWIVHLFV